MFQNRLETYNKISGISLKSITRPRKEIVDPAGATISQLKHYMSQGNE